MEVFGSLTGVSSPHLLCLFHAMMNMSRYLIKGTLYTSPKHGMETLDKQRFTYSLLHAAFSFYAHKYLLCSHLRPCANIKVSSTSKRKEICLRRFICIVFE